MGLVTIGDMDIDPLAIVALGDVDGSDGEAWKASGGDTTRMILGSGQELFTTVPRAVVKQLVNQATSETVYVANLIQPDDAGNSSNLIRLFNVASEAQRWLMSNLMPTEEEATRQGEKPTVHTEVADGVFRAWIDGGPSGVVASMGVH